MEGPSDVCSRPKPPALYKVLANTFHRLPPVHPEDILQGRFKPPPSTIGPHMEALVRQMQSEEIGVPVRCQKLFLTTIPSAFMGYDLVEWLMDNLPIDDSAEALHVSSLLCQYGYFFPVGDARSLQVKDDSSLYRFQTPYFWPSQNHVPDATDHAIYLHKRVSKNRQKHGLEEYELECYNQLKKSLASKWDFVSMQADEQLKMAKDRKKGDKIVSESQERAYWRVYRPPPGLTNTLELPLVPQPSQRPGSRSVSRETLQTKTAFLTRYVRRCRAKLSQVATALLTHYETYHEFDPMLVPVLPSNPWLTDDPTFFELNEPIVECPTELRVKRWAINVSKVLYDPTGLEEFTKYMRKEFCHENIRFWAAVLQLKKAALKDVRALVQSIYNEFLCAGAPCEINIDSRTMELTQERMKNPSRTTFDCAAEHIFELLLKKDCYPRFLRSEQYKNLLITATNPTSKKRFFPFGAAGKKKISTVSPPNANQLVATAGTPAKSDPTVRPNVTARLEDQPYRGDLSHTSKSNTSPTAELSSLVLKQDDAGIFVGESVTTLAIGATSTSNTSTTFTTATSTTTTTATSASRVSGGGRGGGLTETTAATFGGQHRNPGSGKTMPSLPEAIGDEAKTAAKSSSEKSTPSAAAVTSGAPGITKSSFRAVESTPKLSLETMSSKTHMVSSTSSGVEATTASRVSSSALTSISLASSSSIASVGGGQASSSQVVAVTSTTASSSCLSVTASLASGTPATAGASVSVTQSASVPCTSRASAARTSVACSSGRASASCSKSVSSTADAPLVVTVSSSIVPCATKVTWSNQNVGSQMTKVPHAAPKDNQQSLRDRVTAGEPVCSRTSSDMSLPASGNVGQHSTRSQLQCSAPGLQSSTSTSVVSVDCTLSRSCEVRLTADDEQIKTTVSSSVSQANIVPVVSASTASPGRCKAAPIQSSSTDNERQKRTQSIIKRGQGHTASESSTVTSKSCSFALPPPMFQDSETVAAIYCEANRTEAIVETKEPPRKSEDCSTNVEVITASASSASETPSRTEIVKLADGCAQTIETGDDPIYNTVDRECEVNLSSSRSRRQHTSHGTRHKERRVKSCSDGQTTPASTSAQDTKRSGGDRKAYARAVSRDADKEKRTGGKVRRENRTKSSESSGATSTKVSGIFDKQLVDYRDDSIDIAITKPSVDLPASSSTDKRETEERNTSASDRLVDGSSTAGVKQESAASGVSGQPSSEESTKKTSTSSAASPSTDPCPWEDNKAENDKTDAKFVKKYATLGYI